MTLWKIFNASNFALVATINGKTVVKAPDWLYVPKIHERSRSNTSIRRSYTPWAEGEGLAIGWRQNFENLELI